MTMPAPRVSVLMPTFQHAAFIRRALESLLAQTMADWELIIVDDGSPDQTADLVGRYLADPRIHYRRLERNVGLGAALNHALEQAKASLVAYLPSDDLYHADHLASLVDCLATSPGTVLAYSGVQNEFRVPGKGVLANRTSLGQIDGLPLQLVQVMHRATAERWVERDELVTDDLERMFWAYLRPRGAFVSTARISCQWVDHPRQRHKLLQEPLGGINPYRSYYQPKQPLRFHTSVGSPIDEVEHYRRFRERAGTPMSADGLKILLVGELAFNPERVLALEERGHRLYGLWTSDGHWFNTVGPVPFGHVQDLPRSDWRAAVQRLQPDLIYAQLNWETVPFAHEVLTHTRAVPFVWHFKEGPFDCIANGTWPQLVDLYTQSDGQIYCSPEARDWFGTMDPAIIEAGRSLVLDGDLPKREWFTSDRSPRLSEVDGEIHTVVPGGPIGLHPPLIAELGQQGIHLHFYGDFYQRQWPDWVAEAQRLAPHHFHLHPQVGQERWVAEFAQYDAGWLHLFESRNQGDVRQADWSDLNYPARIPTLLAAGVPLIQRDNQQAVVAMQSLARRLDIGIFFSTAEQLAEQLRNTGRMSQLGDNAWRSRDQFTFDYHADRLVEFFRSVIRDHRLRRAPFTATSGLARIDGRTPATVNGTAGGRSGTEVPGPR